MQTRIHDLYRPIEQRKLDFKEVERVISEAEIRQQMQRCHNCGIPFCHGAGCPLFNQIPDFNAAAAADIPETSFEVLRASNKFRQKGPVTTRTNGDGSVTYLATLGLLGTQVMIR